MCDQKKPKLSTNTAIAIIRVHFQPILPVIYCDLNALNTWNCYQFCIIAFDLCGWNIFGKLINGWHFVSFDFQSIRVIQLYNQQTK